jgi:hypothetical protein
MFRCKARKKRGAKHIQIYVDECFVKPLAFSGKECFKHDCTSLRECAPGQQPPQSLKIAPVEADVTNVA